jgi:two-component system, NarL family, sensor histidine kinase LiaS
MSRLHPLQQLHWRFALRYTLLTTAVLLLIEIVLIGGSVFSLWYSEADLTSFARDTGGELLAAFPRSGAGPLDHDAVAAWADQLRRTGAMVTAPSAKKLIFQPERLWDAGSYLVVSDVQFQVLEAIQPVGQTGVPLAATAPPDPLGMLAERARQGERDPARLHQYQRGRLSLVVPVEGRDGHLDALILLSYPLFRDLVKDIRWLDLLGASLLVFGLGSAITGVVFGRTAARPLVRRLGGVAAVTDAWARGDFTPTIADRTADELGRLCTHLNSVAGQLRDLLETRDQLAMLTERQRVARELHDSVKQQLFAITMNLGTMQALWEVDPAEARRRLDTSVRIARQSQQELMAIITALRPAPLSTQRLPGALQEYLDLWSLQTGIPVEQQIDHAVGLTPACEAAIFRIVQEALANSARHSGATRMHVGLAASPDQISLLVRDNGRGFDPGQSGGMGLTSMLERARAIQGRLTIDSTEGGTSLRLDIPRDSKGGIQ